LDRPKFSHGDREKLIGGARNRRQLACREHEDGYPVQHGEEARRCARLLTGERRRSKSEMAEADPSALTSPRFAFSNRGVPPISRAIFKFTGPIWRRIYPSLSLHGTQGPLTCPSRSWVQTSSIRQLLTGELHVDRDGIGTGEPLSLGVIRNTLPACSGSTCSFIWP
jgi:hypothetical protein